MPKTAIIVVNYKTPWHLKQCLKSVFKHTSDFFLYVIHNSQDLESYKVTDFFEKKYPDLIKTYKNKENVGLTEGINTCYLDAIQHKRICLLNSDVIVSANWLLNLNKEMDNNQQISQIMPDCNSFYPDSLFWKIIKLLPLKLNRLQIIQNFLGSPSNPIKESFKPAAHFYDFCGGFCTLFNSEPIINRGYILDTKLAHGYWDDLELSTYLREYGQIGGTSMVHVFHFGGRSIKLFKKKKDLKEKLSELNGFYVCSKYINNFISNLQTIDPIELIKISREVDVVKLMINYVGLTLNKDFRNLDFSKEAFKIWDLMKKV